MRAPQGLYATILLAACPPVVKDAPLVDVVFTHCSDTIDEPEGPVCELESAESDKPRRIGLWVPGELPVVRIDGELQVPTSQVRVDSGWRLAIAVPTGAGALTLSRGDPGQEAWRLPFAWTDPEERPEALQAIDAVQMALGAANTRECRREAKRAFSLAEAQRRGASAMLVAMLGAMCNDAQPWHEWTVLAARIPEQFDDREPRRAFLEAQYFQREGAPAQALASAERGLKTTRRLGLSSLHTEFSTMKASVLGELGEFPAALAVLREEIEHPSTSQASVCDRASLHVNLAWWLMLQAERDQTATDESPREALRRGLQLMETPGNGCRTGEVMAMRLNLVRVLQFERAWQESGRELEALVPGLAQGTDGTVRAELQLLQARQSLASGQFAAADATLRAVDPANELPEDLRLELTNMRGEVAEALGSWRTASEAYDESRRMIQGRVNGLPADGGQSRFVVDRLRGVQRHVELMRSRFLDEAAAFRIAREAAGTEVRWLTQREIDATRRRDYLAGRDADETALVESWHLPPSERRLMDAAAERALAVKQTQLLGEIRPNDPSRLELRPAATGELLLLYFPLDAYRYVAFAATETDVESVIIDLELSALPVVADVWSDAELEKWSDLLLGPLAGSIERAHSIRVLPSFGVQVLPFHALPWRGRPLLEHAKVVYSLDLPERGERRKSTVNGRILVVADPLGDLGGAREESAALQASMGMTDVEVLEGRLLATGPNVRASLARAEHFHYAGHSAAVGVFGWASTLRLAQGTSLSIADIVALDRVPSTVVLVSCDGGHISPDPRTQGISLAAAFIFSGSDVVVAMSRPIGADEAPVLASTLGRLTDASSLVEMYRTGLLRLRKEGMTDTAWQALRVWVP